MQNREMQNRNEPSALIEKLLQPPEADVPAGSDADLFVAGKLVVEIKACRCLVDDHVAQLLGYLRASRIEHGLLINFGSPKLQIKKYILNKDG